MSKNVKVIGKGQNRTALGIVNAYLIINPKATLADLQKAFPDSLNPDSGIKINFIEVEKMKKDDLEWKFFHDTNEILTLKNGTQVAVTNMWTEESLKRLIKRAEKYGIQTSYISCKKGERGEFSLEVKKSKWWIWVLLAVIVVVILIILLLPKDEDETAVQNVEQTKTEYVQKIEKIEKDFNAARFEKNESELNEDAKTVLHSLAELMRQHTNVRLSIEGHTSAEGTAEVNQKLSEERATAAVDYLVQVEGIEKSRLQAVGKGSSQPKDENNPETNRRTEFIVLE